MFTSKLHLKVLQLFLTQGKKRKENFNQIIFRTFTFTFKTKRESNAHLEEELKRHEI